jgi:peptidoglycan hydrolase-like protein with peptidoglycan-binding domain
MRYVTRAAGGLLLLAMGSTGAVAAPPPLVPAVDPAIAPVVRVVADATVVWVQRFLSERGFYNGAVDGLAGAHTQAAVRAYEASVAWPITGSAHILAQKLGYGTPAAPVVVVPAPVRPAPVVVAPHPRHRPFPP